MVVLQRPTDFQSMLDEIEPVQSDYLLNRVIGPNQDSEYGRRHQFHSLRTVQDFRDAVPINRYEDIRGYIDRIKMGEAQVLVSEPVRHFFVTSGSTATPKHIPVTNSFVQDKLRAFTIYWNYVNERYPQIMRGKTTANFADTGIVGRTQGNIPCSSESTFWSRMTAVSRKRSHFAVPDAVANIKDSDTRYYVLARLLINEDLTVLMSLNPSTILLLLRKFNEFAGPLLLDLEQGGLSADCNASSEVCAFVAERCPPKPERAEKIRIMLKNGPFLTPAALWPNLELVISWRSATLQPYLNLLKPYMAATPHHDYITMASEGIIAIPVESEVSGGVLAAGIHFYEFIPEEDVDDESAESLLPHELEIGRNYVVVLTTTSGLYRYNIGDVVRVNGFAGRTPRVEFLYRAGATCSLTGEKLTEAQVCAAMSAAAGDLQITLTSFTAMPATNGFPHYAVLAEFLEQSDAQAAKQLLAAFDRELALQNIEYRAKRDSQRLGPPELWMVRAQGYEALRQRRITAGTNDGQIKPVFLTRDFGFHKHFEIMEVINADSLG